MGAVPETAVPPSAMAIISTPSTIATTTSEASSPPHLSEIEDLGYENIPHADHTNHPIIDGHATGVSSTEASSPELSAHAPARSATGHVSDTSSQGRYDNTVNEYDLVKEASRAKGQKSRTVCVAIPVNRKDGTVLMVTSRKHDTKWIFPKGGHETGETYAEAAVREAWEEAGTSPTLVLTEPEVYSASSMSGNGERQIHYHIFEMGVTPEDLCQDWPEASQRNREFVTIPKALERCAAWANEKNTKMELVIGFRKTRVFQEWYAASQQDSTSSTDSNATLASLRQTGVLGAPTCDGLTNHPQDADNGDLIEAKKRRGVGTDADDVADAQKPGLLEKMLNFVHPTKSQ